MSDSVTAAVLGIVEGVTEFLPISSTGHLILVGNLLNFTGEKAITFQIFIQLGAILAVLTLYHRRFEGLFRFSAPPTDGFAGFAGLGKLALGCLPACIAGLALHKVITGFLFTPTSVATALFLGGLIMILVEYFPRPERVDSIESISYRDALLVGLIQTLALWPGVSRSGATIIGGLLLGMNRRVAAEFSFLLAAPLLLAATVYELIKNWHLLTGDDIVPFGIGFTLSFLSAYLAVRWFIGLLGRWTLVPFGYYRIALSVAVAVVLSR